MLVKNNRVTKTVFQNIMKEGLFLSGSLFTFRYIYQKSLNCAFVAPKSVSKKAVTRNKLRRQGYSALRSSLSTSPTGVKTTGMKNIACIFFYKKQAKNASFQEIKNDIENILKKIK